nr:probable serine/threonine-protein phosphatase 2A regulatory subunit B'' subunit TON2 [Tanacetum cinerariifolium]
DVHQKWIEGGNYELCIEDVQDEIWDMVKPADPLRITLSDLLALKQGGTIGKNQEAQAFAQTPWSNSRLGMGKPDIATTLTQLG